MLFQRLLSQELAATKEKLEALKAAREQANAALEAVTITKDQYDALQTEIIETENALEDLEKQADESSVALIKLLYYTRWAIEGSFRKLKYTIGLSNFHAKN